MRKILLVIVLMLFTSVAYGATGDPIGVISTTRITPARGDCGAEPCAYSIGNVWFGQRPASIWNLDYTKMSVYEAPADVTSESDYVKAGRGLVWGLVTDFKTWTDTDDYESKVVPFPEINDSASGSGSHERTNPAAGTWSILTGEEHIYYITAENGWVLKIDTEPGTPTVTEWVQFDPTTGDSNWDDIGDAWIAGWTSDDTVIVAYDRDNWSTLGTEIDLVAKTSTPFTSYPWLNLVDGGGGCPAEYLRWPDFDSHGHGGKNPGRTKETDNNCTQGSLQQCIWDITTPSSCAIESTKVRTLTTYPVHYSWKASDNWMIYNSGGAGTTLSTPTLYPWYLYATIYNSSLGTFEDRLLLSHSVSERWDLPGDGVPYSDCTAYSTACASNYHTHFIATGSLDGNYVLFTSTGTLKYTYQDYRSSISQSSIPDISLSDYEVIGAYLVDVSRESLGGSGEIVIVDAGPNAAYQVGTTEATLTARTEDGNGTALAATCRYSTTSGKTYADMTDTFASDVSVTTNTTHTQDITGLTNGTTYTYYFHCAATDQDYGTTINATRVVFSVLPSTGGGGGDTQSGITAGGTWSCCEQ